MKPRTTRNCEDFEATKPTPARVKDFIDKHKDFILNTPTKLLVQITINGVNHGGKFKEFANDFFYLYFKLKTKYILHNVSYEISDEKPMRVRLGKCFERIKEKIKGRKITEFQKSGEAVIQRVIKIKNAVSKEGGGDFKNNKRGVLERRQEVSPPHTIPSYIETTVTETRKIKSIKFNSGISKTKFDELDNIIKLQAELTADYIASLEGRKTRTIIKDGARVDIPIRYNFSHLQMSRQIEKKILSLLDGIEDLSEEEIKERNTRREFLMNSLRDIRRINEIPIDFISKISEQSVNSMKAAFGAVELDKKIADNGALEMEPEDNSEEDKIKDLSEKIRELNLQYARIE